MFTILAQKPPPHLPNQSFGRQTTCRVQQINSGRVILPLMTTAMKKITLLLTVLLARTGLFAQLQSDNPMKTSMDSIVDKAARAYMKDSARFAPAACRPIHLRNRVYYKNIYRPARSPRHHGR